MRRSALFLLAFLWTFVALPASAQTSAPDSTVNVVVIFADDLGYGDLSSYGQTAWETPVLDRMAAEGARLTQFYVPVPYCAPSRATLLTGRYPFHHGFTKNPAPDAPPSAGLDTIGLDSAEVTLGEAFQQAGYATSLIGKWHLGHQPGFYPTEHGFDEYYGILYSNDMRPVELVEDTAVVEYPVMQATLTERYTDRALDFIERNQEEPFFLYLAHAMPHKPLAPSPDFYTPETREDLYADVLRELDHSVGRVLEKIAELGLDRQTLVIFLSDNGPWFGGSTGGLRGMKAQTWEGGTKVPFIARWPGQIPEGHESDAVTGSIDVFPTVLQAAGLPLPDGPEIDGRNLMPVLTSDAPSPHEAVYTMSGPHLRTVRSGRWKLHVRAPTRPGYMDVVDPENWDDPRGPDGVTIMGPYEQPHPGQHPGLDTGDAPEPMMLFDLESDPAEQHNIAAEHPDVVERLKALFDEAEAASEVQE